VYRKVLFVRRKIKYICLLLNYHDVLFNTKSVVTIVSKLRYPLQPADGDGRLSGDASCVTYNRLDGTVLQEQAPTLTTTSVACLDNIKLKD
jgi:hypothetical protein